MVNGRERVDTRELTRTCSGKATFVSSEHAGVPRPSVTGDDVMKPGVTPLARVFTCPVYGMSSNVGQTTLESFDSVLSCVRMIFCH
jgi:hypothetical protein